MSFIVEISERQRALISSSLSYALNHAIFEGMNLDEALLLRDMVQDLPHEANEPDTLHSFIS